MPARVALAGALLGAALAGNAAVAAQGDVLTASLSQTFYFEDNLYRLPSMMLGPDGGSDRISITSVGLNVDRFVGRQRVQAGLGVSRTRYARHDELDYTAPSASFGWDWRVGRQWSGRFAYHYNEEMAGFEDIASTDKVVRRYSRLGVGADYWWHPDWATGADVAWVGNRYRDDIRPGQEYDARDVGVNLTYRPVSGNRLVFSLRQTDGNYPQRAALPGSIRDFTQREGRVNGEWQVSGAMRVSGYAGYTHRTYDLAPNRDFTGMTGRVSLLWQPTGKLLLELQGRREIGAEEDLVANYLVTRAVRAAPSWIISDKLRLTFSLEQIWRDYGGDPDLGFGGLMPDRDDSTRRQTLTLRYAPTRTTQLSLGLQRQRRDSAFVLREYEANSAWVSGQILF